MTRRQAPRPKAFAELLRFERPTLDRTAARLKRAHTIADLRDIAKRVTPRTPFDYTDGAAEAEVSLQRARLRAASRRCHSESHPPGSPA